MDSTTSQTLGPSRRILMGTALTTAATGAIGIAASPTASAATRRTGGLTLRDGFGLTLRDAQRWDWERRLVYLRFGTAHIQGWGGGGPGVNVLLPASYDANPRKRYPVIYAFHGGGPSNDFREWHRYYDIVRRTAGTDVIVVMPDGGHGSFYIDAGYSRRTRRNWESFHIKQLIPWVDANLRTIPTRAGRAAMGISMGGYGTLKYGARFPNLFTSLSALSAPSDTLFGPLQAYMWLSPVVDGLPFGSLLGPVGRNMSLRRLNDPQSRVPRYRGMQMNLYTGLGDFNIVKGFKLDYNEDVVAPQTWWFARKLQRAGIPRTYKVFDGGHGMDTWGPALDDALPRVMSRLQRAS